MTAPVTTVVESKLRTGVLKLGAPDATVPVPMTEFGCQATSVVISPSYKEDGDPVETLCGGTLPAATTVSRVLKIVAIQDFENADGFMVFLRTHELETLDFEWQASPAAEVATGTLQARLGDWGGEVAKRVTTSPEMPIITISWAPATP
jgi:hypothetical protein